MVLFCLTLEIVMMKGQVYDDGSRVHCLAKHLSSMGAALAISKSRFKTMVVEKQQETECLRKKSRYQRKGIGFIRQRRNWIERDKKERK